MSDETNELYEDMEYFSWDQLVAEDRHDNYEWNHQLHPNQKKFPGMTRWDVLCERINPTLQSLDKLTLARYEVYIFQGDKYIDHVEKVQTYNRVIAEQTVEDTVNYIEQRKKIAKFGKYVREHAIEEVSLMKNAVRENQTTQDEPEELEVVAVVPQHAEHGFDGQNGQYGHDPIGDI